MILGYVFLVNLNALYIEQSIWGKKGQLGHQVVRRKQRHCAGYVTNMDTWPSLSLTGFHFPNPHFENMRFTVGSPYCSFR